MPGASTRTGKSGLFGHPSIIFWLMVDFGQAGSNMGNLIMLDKWFFQFVGYLSAKDKAVYERDYEERLLKIMVKLNDCWGNYLPEFEGLSFNPSEKNFVLGLRDVYCDLAIVTAESHICDRVEYDRDDAAEVE